MPTLVKWAALRLVPKFSCRNGEMNDLVVLHDLVVSDFDGQGLLLSFQFCDNVRVSVCQTCYTERTFSLYRCPLD